MFSFPNSFSSVFSMSSSSYPTPYIRLLHRLMFFGDRWFSRALLKSSPHPPRPLLSPTSRYSLASCTYARTFSPVTPETDIRQTWASVFNDSPVSTKRVRRQRLIPVLLSYFLSVQNQCKGDRSNYCKAAIRLNWCSSERWSKICCKTCKRATLSRRALLSGQ